jgi:LmbE family N-acetylglucosaminyl deacetylase
VRVLAIGAHPDDVELGCGGTLLRHLARGDEITILVMTGGERGVYDARSRPREQQYAADLAGATLIWGGFADGALPQGPDAISVVDRAVAISGAEILYTHAPDDSHQDHIATSSICLAAARRVPTVLYYETPSTLEFMPTVFIDLDEVMERKISLVRAHLSQVLRDGPVDLDALVAQARFRGSQSRTQHAEAFRPARFLWDLLSAPHHGPAHASEPETARIDRATELRAISEVAGSLSR